MATIRDPDWSPEAAREWLYSLQPRGIKLGLDRVREALARIGSPHERLKAVTIAGTNGKGSTAAFLAAITHAAGYRVGLYTSPHLVEVTERIQVGGTPILPHELTRWTGVVHDLVEGSDGVPLTFFEALTVVALGYFAEREVDLAVLEVGMGGRLDATAVVPPLAALLTPIGLDHTAFLGDSVEAICREKAGIIQPGSTVITNITPELFAGVVGPIAFERRCPIRRAGVDFVHQELDGGMRYRGWIHRVGPVALGLNGIHQSDNAALACAAAESLAAHGFNFRAVHLAEGLRRARHPGRLDRRERGIDAAGRRWPAMLLDGAHNPLGAHVLGPQVRRWLPERPRVMLFTTRLDKDVAGILGALGEHVDSLVLTRLPDQPAPPLEPVMRAAREHGLDLHVEHDLDGALDLALDRAGPGGGLLVTGSLYLVGHVLPRLPRRQDLQHTA